MAEYIERGEAIKCAEESYKMWCLSMAAADGEREINKCYKMQDVCKAIGEVFKIVPTADVAQVVHGRWIDVGERYDDYDECFYTVFKCSRCGTTKEEYPTSNYCPNCGAKMEEEA